MKDLPNIERSAFKASQYVGYGGGVWRIFKRGDHWEAHRRPGGFIRAATLEGISQQLAAYAKGKE